MAFAVSKFSKKAALISHNGLIGMISNFVLNQFSAFGLLFVFQVAVDKERAKARRANLRYIFNGVVKVTLKITSGTGKADP